MAEAPRCPADLTGQRFGRLVVERRHEMRSGVWWCRCDCGAVRMAYGSRLMAAVSSVKSCGCLRRDNAIANGRASKTHGHTRNGHISPTYTSWQAMWERCTRKTHKYFNNYGGRGIEVCERWHTFENFLKDMGERPVDSTLDRFPDKNGNYEPGNCRWATAKQQGNNTRFNRCVTINGVTKTWKEWAEHIGLKYSTLKMRMYKGWEPEKAILTPVRK